MSWSRAALIAELIFLALPVSLLYLLVVLGGLAFSGMMLTMIMPTVLLWGLLLAALYYLRKIAMAWVHAQDDYFRERFWVKDALLFLGCFSLYAILADRRWLDDSSVVLSGIFIALLLVLSGRAIGAVWRMSLASLTNNTLYFSHESYARDVFYGRIGMLIAIAPSVVSPFLWWMTNGVEGGEMFSIFYAGLFLIIPFLHVSLEYHYQQHKLLQTTSR